MPDREGAGTRHGLYLPRERWLVLDADERQLARFIRPNPGGDRLTARVRGTVSRQGRTVVLSVNTVESAPPPEPIVVRSVTALRARRRRYNGAYIQLEGTEVHRFEVSSFDGMWLSHSGDVKIRCSPVRIRSAPSGGRFYRSRITGIVLTRGRHGHLGGYREEIIATEIVHLGDRDCDAD